MVEVTVQISHEDARMYRSMASMGRWCDQIRRALDKAEDELQQYRDSIAPEVDDPTEDAIEELQFALQQLDLLKPAVSNIHYVLREKLVKAGVEPLWDQS